MRTAIARWCEDAMDVRYKGSDDPNLIELAISHGIDVIVTTRKDAAELSDRVPDSITLIGVSATSSDVLVCRGREVHHVNNPSPQQLRELVVGRGR